MYFVTGGSIGGDSVARNEVRAKFSFGPDDAHLSTSKNKGVFHSSSATRTFFEKGEEADWTNMGLVASMRGGENRCGLPNSRRTDVLTNETEWMVENVTYRTTNERIYDSTSS